MQRKSSVTVIIPVCNNEKTIIDSLQSILDTSYENLKIIVFDDGSTDSSIEKVYEFRNQNKNLEIKVFTHSNNQNKGVSFTRNQALKHTDSTYVSFLDADDIYFSNRFDEVISLLDNDLSIDAAFGLFERYQEPCPTLSTPFLKSNYPNSNFLINNFSDLQIGEPVSLASFFSGGSGIHISTITFRNSSLQKLEGFPDLKFSEDHALFIRAISTQKIVKATNQSVSIYRINSQSSCFKGKNTIEFNYSNILAYYDTINWLQKKSPSNIAIRILKEKIPGKLFFSYSKPLQTAQSNQAIMNIFINALVFNPSLFFNLNFHKILLKSVIFILLKF
ncbi:MULTISPECIES: glycosyltransferase family 2 protein [unclassified Synechocystis]|uniref:glycosyltransferase family 2 protein n=1 Tax=unclassified Synechocystis TaxID=2640012 RepID=UPI0003FFA0E6|nr:MULTISPECIES: glycosyltransferase family 2 protein [unclassified Synechocystis]AIE74675.1 Beta-1,3-glucosyltransferase [Synechocystis sp. PCC 6714]MCT0253970.1 glycosyltransferase family 2 protein [Synechocystis sp. CS-94]